MERAYFFSGQRVSDEDINTITSTISADVKHRTIDFFTPGVVGNNSDVFVLNDLNNTIRILPFVAYNTAGERINVYKEIGALALDLSKPEERRLRQRGNLEEQDFGWELNTTYDIYIAYIEKPGKPKAQYTTGIFYPTRVYTGFEFYAIRPGIDNITSESGNTAMVRLCRITYDGTTLSIVTDGYMDIASMPASKIFTTENAEPTVVYNPLTPVSIQDHIMCLGSGTPSPQNPHGYTPEDLGFDAVSVQTHEQRMHTSGLTGSRSALNSCLYIGLNSITTAQDNLILHNLAGSERLHINGNWLSSIALTGSSFFLQFYDGTAPNYTSLPEGTYRIGLTTTTGEIVVGANTTESIAGRQMIVSKDSSAIYELTRISLIDINTFEKSGYFPLAEFVFVPTNGGEKPISTILNTVPRSNFTSKRDMRVFGSTSTNELATEKVNGEDYLKLPYTVLVNKVVLANGTEISNSSTLPVGYIQGLIVNYASDNTITVTKGSARDSKNLKDIVLNVNMTKRVDLPWVPGGISGAVGGLQNAANPYLNTPGGYPLHVFVIMTETGTVDVAIDTDVTGVHIVSSTSATATYKYIRRIGSVAVRPQYGTSQQDTQGNVISTDTAILAPFLAYQVGTGVWTYYRDRTELFVYANSDQEPDYRKKFTQTMVPSGSLFLGKFNAVGTGTINYYTLQAPAVISMVTGTTFEVPMSDQTLRLSEQWNANNHIYCVAYYDGRN